MRDRDERYSGRVSLGVDDVCGGVVRLDGLQEGRDDARGRERRLHCFEVEGKRVLRFFVFL